MKAYDERKLLLGVLTLNDISVTQSRGKSVQFFTV